MAGRMVEAARAASRVSASLTTTLLIPAFVSEGLGAAREAARSFIASAIARPVYTKLFERSGFGPR